MSLTVELVYDRDCPNVPAARAQLLRAFNVVGLAPLWREWDVRQADVPVHARGYGSPTILVDGADVAGGEPAGTDVCCRIYAGHSGPRGVPPLAQIVAALRPGVTSTAG